MEVLVVWVTALSMVGCCSTIRIPSQRKLVDIIQDPSTSTDVFRRAVRNLETEPELAFWRALGSNESIPLQSRQIAVLRIFAGHLNPTKQDIVLADLGKVLGYPYWLRIEDIKRLDVFNGALAIPLKAAGQHGSIFEIELLPAHNLTVTRKVVFMVDRRLSVADVHRAITDSSYTETSRWAHILEVGSLEFDDSIHWTAVNEFGLKSSENNETMKYPDGKAVSLKVWFGSMKALT